MQSVMQSLKTSIVSFVRFKLGKRLFIVSFNGSFVIANGLRCYASADVVGAEQAVRI